MIAVIDNRDSFVHNLARHLRRQGWPTEVLRCDEVTVADVAALRPSHVVISPGPCTPEEAGVSVPLVRALGPAVPTLGVCLGHQAIGAAFGASIVRGREPVHGKTSAIEHDGRTIFAGLERPMTATRYHSLVIHPDLAPDLVRTAWCDGDVVMGVRHRSYPVEGVQFHPESILTGSGKALLANFLALEA